MRQITKHKEPKVLSEYRCKPGATYNGFQSKKRMQALRVSLVSEQGGICCYCMQRIRAKEDRMKVEHWHSQADYPAEQLDYRNMLGVCMGNMGQPEELEHCDTRRGDEELSRNPANPTHRIEDFIRYLGDGTIDSTDAALKRDLGDDVLHLNLEILVSNRKAVLDGFTTGLKKKGALGKGELRRMIKDWGAGTRGVELSPFCGVVVYWLRKRLARI